MERILITAATIRELSPLLRSLGAQQTPARGVPDCYETRVGCRPVSIAVTGLGKVNTAAATAILVTKLEPSLLINIGCGGAYTGSGLQVGDLALACSETYGDEGVVTSAGWHDLQFIGIPLCQLEGKRYFNEMPMAAAWTDKACRVAESEGLPVKVGKFVTVSTCSGTLARGNELAGRFGAICENMEGAAAAHVALTLGVECMEVRGISNMVEDRDLSRWNIDLAVENVSKLVSKLIPVFADNKADI